MRRTLIAVLVAAAVVLLPGAPAWAHNSLIGSTPADGAVLKESPSSVSLRFLQKLNPSFTTIVVSNASRQRIPAGEPAVDEGTGTITLTGVVPNGVYTVAYRIVSVDGHTVQGDYNFTVADPSQPAAAPVASAAAQPEPAKSGLPLGLLIGTGVAILLLAALAAYFVFSSDRRTRSG